jgi:uncharacterized protein (TIGR02001 family)
MKRFLLAAAAAVVAPGAVSAQDITTYYGAALTSDYISGGYSYSDGPAFQPYVEMEHSSGLYLGVWMSTIDGDLGGLSSDDSVEIDLYLGYRGSAGPLSYDISYYRYFYDDSGNCCGEAILALDYSLGDTLGMTTTFAADLEGGASVTQGFAYTLPADFELSGEYTWNNEDYGDYNDWNIGIGKSLSDTVSVDLRYHDSDDTDPLYALTISFDTSIGGQ